MILRSSSKRGTRCNGAAGVSLGRDSNRDPDRNRANSINEFNTLDERAQMSRVSSVDDLGNGSLHHIFRCGSKRCLFQNKFLPLDRIVSTTTNRIYDCIVPPGTTYLNEHSSNVIYLLTCNSCRLQYVGESSQNLNERFNWHNSCFRNPSKYSFCDILNTHFHKGKCKDSTYTVSIIEKLEGSGQTASGAMDPKYTPARKARELFWIKELRTAFPYGLNHRIGDEPVTEDSSIRVGTKFRALPRRNARYSRGRRHNGTTVMNSQKFINDLNALLLADITRAPNFIRISLASMKKCHLKMVHQLVTDILSNESPLSSYKQYFLQCIDIIECKLYKPISPKRKKKSPENVCSIFFDNKGVEFINMARILRNPDIVSSIPKTPKPFSTPMVTYKLDAPTSCKIFNFNKFVNSLDIDEFLANPNILPCECDN